MVLNFVVFFCDFALFYLTRCTPACSWRTWFLKIDLVRMSVCVCVCVCVFVCPPPRLLITSDVILTLCDWVNKFCSCYMATVVGIIDGRGFGIDTCCGN